MTKFPNKIAKVRNRKEKHLRQIFSVSQCTRFIRKTDTTIHKES